MLKLKSSHNCLILSLSLFLNILILSHNIIFSIIHLKDYRSLSLPPFLTSVLLLLMCCICIDIHTKLSWIVNKKFSSFFSGVVPKPTSQVASAGEAGGEFHQAPGHFLLSALFQPLSHQHFGLRSAAGPLALHPSHHLHLPAVTPRLHRWLTGPPGHLHSFSSPFHALFLAKLLPELPSPGTQPSSVPHRLYVPPTPGVPVLSWSKELQYCLTEDESKGTHSVYWKDVVMLRGRQSGLQDPKSALKTDFPHADWIVLCWKISRVKSTVDIQN